MAEYALIALFLAAAIIFVLVAFLLAFIVRPRKPNPIKQATYECGLETEGETWVQFRIQYYVFALVFLVFDIETAFLFPWAVVYKQLGLFALLEMGVFVVILLGGLLYAWRKGDLEWV